MIWILIALAIVIAYLHDNYNLGVVILGGGAFIGFLATILETEGADFVRMYVNTRHFVVRTLLETLYNTALYLFPLVAALFFLFPAERSITLLFFPAVLLINVQLLWTKYAFYPSSLLAAVVFFFGLLLQGDVEYYALRHCHSTGLYGSIVFSFSEKYSHNHINQ